MNTSELDKITSSKYAASGGNSTQKSHISKQPKETNAVYYILLSLGIIALFSTIILAATQKGRLLVICAVIVGSLLMFLAEFYKAFRLTRDIKASLKSALFYFLQILAVALLVQLSM